MNSSNCGCIQEFEREGWVTFRVLGGFGKRMLLQQDQVANTCLIYNSPTNDF